MVLHRATYKRKIHSQTVTCIGSTDPYPSLLTTYTHNETLSSLYTDKLIILSLAHVHGTINNRVNLFNTRQYHTTLYCKSIINTRSHQVMSHHFSYLVPGVSWLLEVGFWHWTWPHRSEWLTYTDNVHDPQDKRYQFDLSYASRATILCL